MWFRLWPLGAALVLLFTVVGGADAQAPTSTPVPTDTPMATPSITSTLIPTMTLSPATPTGTAAPTAANLSLTVAESSNPVPAGQTLTYFIIVQNQGGTSSPQTRLTGQIPAGTTVSAVGPGCFPDSLAQTLTCIVPTLAPGAVASLWATLNVTAPSGAIFNRFQVDPDNSVPETDKSDNTASTTTIVTAAPSTVAPTATGVPPVATETPVPPPAATLTAVPTPTGPPGGQLWLRILGATQAFSPTMRPLWVAQPGEWYFVVAEEAGWALGIWEGDTAEETVWIQIDSRAELQMADRPIPSPQLWLVVFTPTQTYSVTNDPLWVALPGEWYRVVRQESGWALAIWESDPPEWSVWIPLDGVQLTRP